MASLEKDHSYSGHPQQPTDTAEEYAVPEVVITRRLRDRELLRKRKAEAEEKDTHQYQKRSRPSRRGRRAGRGQGRHQAQKSHPEPQQEPQPELQPELQPVTSQELEHQPEAPQATSVEEKAEIPLELPGEPSVPHVDPEQLYTQQVEVAEVAPAGDAIFSVGLEETPCSEEPQVPQSLGNDHLEQELYGSF